MAQQSLSSLRAAALDGRAQNVFYRLEQLERLHKALVTESSAVLDAITRDSGNTPAEAKIEFALALEALKDRYVELDPHKALEDEYAIANKHNAEGLRTGVGIVLIKPARHTLFYSILVPLVAAIAAGNLVVVQLETGSQAVTSLLEKLTASSLDHDSCVFVKEPVKDESLLANAVQVIQNEASPGPATLSHIVSTPSAMTVAIVDRSANFDEAAKALIAARFAFRGKSPYAPDLVLVNEFVKKDLLQALVRQSISSGAKVSIENGSAEKQAPRRNGFKEAIDSYQGDFGAQLVTQSAHGAILEVPKRSASLISKKVVEPTLLVHTMMSMDDAIDYLNSSGKPLLAGYHFGDAPVGKYLSQFVSTQVSFVNHIPPEILVGPAFPLNHAVDPSTRYPTTLFSKPAPAFISPSPSSQVLSKAFDLSNAQESAAALQAVFAQAISSLPLKKRRKQITASFGYFEQAFLLHFGTLFFSSVGIMIGGAWWLRNGQGWRPWR